MVVARGVLCHPQPGAKPPPGGQQHLVAYAFCRVCTSGRSGRLRRPPRSFAAGLYVGSTWPPRFSPAARVQTATTWGMVAFTLENLVFILIGLELPHLIHETQPQSLGQWLAVSAAISLVVILLRLATVLPSPFLWRALTRSQAGQPDLRKVALVGWMGVRGADSVVIALALPHLTAAGAGFPARALIIFITFGVVFATLVLQGLSIGPLTRWLGLQGDTQLEQEEAHARHVVASAGLKSLEELAGTGGNSSEIAAELRRRSQRRARRWETRETPLGHEPIARHDLDSGDDGGSETHALDYRRFRAAMIDAERRAWWIYREPGHHWSGSVTTAGA